MAKIVVEEAKDYALLPVDSIVNLRVKEVEVREVNGDRGTWQKLEFTFEILGIQATGDGSPIENYEAAVGTVIWGSCPFRLTDSQENKLRLWAEAILGIELGVGFELDTDAFLRREVRGVTSQYDKKAKNPVTNLPFKSHQVDSLLRSGGTVPPPQSQGFAFGQPVQQMAPPTAPQGQPLAPAGAPAQPASAQPAWSDPPPF